FDELGVQRLGRHVIQRRQCRSAGRRCRLVLRERLSAVEGIGKCRVAVLDQTHAAAGFVRIDSPAGYRKARDLREIGREVVEDASGIKISEKAYAAANDGFVSRWAPCESNARLKHNLFHITQNAASSGGNHLIERNRRIVRQILEGEGRNRNAL